MRACVHACMRMSVQICLGHSSYIYARISKLFNTVFFSRGGVVSFEIFKVGSTSRSHLKVKRFVVLLFYVHGKHLRSCRDGQLT